MVNFRNTDEKMSLHYKYISTEIRHIKEIWNRRTEVFTGRYLVEIQRNHHKFFQTFISLDEAKDFLRLVENDFQSVKDLGSSTKYINKDVDLFKRVRLRFDSEPQILILNEGKHRTYNIPSKKVDEIYEWAKFAKSQRVGKDQGRATAKRLKTIIRRGKEVKNKQQSIFDD